MFAFVKEADGSLYRTAVFGAFNDKVANDTAFDAAYQNYYLILNRDKTGFCKKYSFVQDAPVLKKALYFYEFNRDDWNLVTDDDFYGHVAWLTRAEVQRLLRGEAPSPQALQKALAIDAKAQFDLEGDLTSWDQIEMVLGFTGGFRGAYLESLAQRKAPDQAWTPLPLVSQQLSPLGELGSEAEQAEFGGLADREDQASETDGPLEALRVDLRGPWGWSASFEFQGQIAYSTLSRDPDLDDPVWEGGEMGISDDGLITLVDDEEVKEYFQNDFYTWFQGKKVHYRLGIDE